MKNVKIITVIVAVFAILIWFNRADTPVKNSYRVEQSGAMSFRVERTGSSPRDIDLTAYIEESRFDESDTPGQIEEHVVIDDKIYAIVSLSGLPGQNGLTMNVIEVDLKGGGILKIREGINMSSLVLSPENKYLSVKYAVSSSACVRSIGYEIINLMDKSHVLIRPPYEVSKAGGDLNRDIVNGKWSKEHEFEFKVESNDCGTVISTDKWQYDLLTNKCTQI